MQFIVSKYQSRSTDVPLPPENQSSLPSLPNGTASGNASRPHTWGTSNWPLNGAPPTAANSTKPPLGRDPKSRARSRDYIKQFVLLSPEMLHVIKY